MSSHVFLLVSNFAASGWVQLGLLVRQQQIFVANSPKSLKQSNAQYKLFAYFSQVYFILKCQIMTGISWHLCTAGQDYNFKFTETQQFPLQQIFGNNRKKIIPCNEQKLYYYYYYGSNCTCFGSVVVWDIVMQFSNSCCFQLIGFFFF